MLTMGEMKDYLRLPLEVGPEDELLTGLEQSCVDWLESQTHKYYGIPAEAVLTLDGPTAGPIYLPQAPSVDEDGNPILVVESWNGSDWESVEAADYTLDGAALHHGSAWTPGTRNYRVTYTRGFNDGDQSARVKLAVLQLVALHYEFRLPIVTGTIVAELPFGLRETIKNLRRVRV